MNAPERDEIFYHDPSQAKVVIIKDTKIPNAATAKILKEDHTLGNLLRYQLLKNPKVLFAGYQLPHPLQYEVHIKVQTTPDYSPSEAISDALEQCMVEFQKLHETFELQFNTFGGEQPGLQGGYY